MKNHHMWGRFNFALTGLRATIRTERSFRCHLIAVGLVLLLLLVTRPAPVWWGILLLASGFMMVTEIINTAVEKLVDHMHPAQHEAIGMVKDTLAAAVLVSCIAAGLALLAFLWMEFGL